MDIHVCKQCGSRFVYCRACTFRPVRYKDAGFCSKECYEASKIPTVEPEIIEVVAVVEEPAPIIEEVLPVIEDVAVEAEAVIEAIAPIEEPVVEATPKKETNTYKKKKNKY